MKILKKNCRLEKRKKNAYETCATLPKWENFIFFQKWAWTYTHGVCPCSFFEKIFFSHLGSVAHVSYAIFFSFFKSEKKIKNFHFLTPLTPFFEIFFEITPLGGTEKQLYHAQQAYFFQDLRVLWVTHTY